jgi:hypothetical protein
MAQISVSDESFQKIEELAQERQVTPEQLIELALIQLEIAQERAEYGDAFIEELRQQANAPRPPDTHIDMTDEEFFAAIRGSVNADI